jgi:hypothetical protein
MKTAAEYKFILPKNKIFETTGIKGLNTIPIIIKIQKNTFVLNLPARS